jgi:hypothetical protein
MLGRVRRLLVPRWLIIHAVAAGLVLVFLALGWWQLHRAASGNTRSYAYAVEWPSFALLVIGFWVKICRDDLRSARRVRSEPGDGAPAVTGTGGPARTAEAAELAAYNRYIAARTELRRAAVRSGPPPSE